MRRYLDIKNEFGIEHALSELEEHGRLNEYSTPKVDDTGRMIVHVDIRGPKGMVFNVEGEYKLIQKFLDKIKQSRN